MTWILRAQCHVEGQCIRCCLGVKRISRYVEDVAMYETRERLAWTWLDRPGLKKLTMHQRQLEPLMTISKARGLVAAAWLASGRHQWPSAATSMSGWLLVSRDRQWRCWGPQTTPLGDAGPESQPHRMCGNFGSVKLAGHRRGGFLNLEFDAWTMPRTERIGAHRDGQEPLQSNVRYPLVLHLSHFSFNRCVLR